MKKILYTMACLVAALCFVACGHNEPNEPNKPNEGDNGNVTPTDYATVILGHWVLESAYQDNGSANPVDMTPMYGGSAFQLTFQEGGVLLCDNGVEQAEMAYTIEGDIVNFIQAPGADPVPYLIKQCDETTLVIVHGVGSDYETTMTLKRS